MKKFPWEKMSVEEIGAAICSHLKLYNIPVVLSGGGCVTIYSENEYESRDLDFVMGDYSPSQIDLIMKEVGFVRTRDIRHYEHPECPYFIEFPPSPLSVGEEFVTNVASRTNKYGILQLLRPIDSIKDRLAAFYHWNDRQSLEQALMIARRHKIDLKELKRWSEKEGMREKHEVFLASLQKQAG